MTYHELVKLVSAYSGVTQGRVRQVLSSLVDVLRDALPPGKENNVQTPLGIFQKYHYEERTIHMPNYGDTIFKERFVVKLKPHKNLKILSDDSDWEKQPKADSSG